MEIMGHYASSSSEEYKRKQREYDEVLAQLKKLKKSSGESDRDLVRSFLPALGDVPELALEMIRLKRNVEIQSTVYSMLVKEYEKARIEEARDTPTVQILDRAEVPNLRSRPRRKMLVILGGVVGAGWAAIIALFTTAWRENRESAAAWRDVFSPLVGDFSRLIHRRKPPAS
jgi:tyrosine-protein kinase Etk/Wzc